MGKGTVYKRRDGRWKYRISMGKDENGKGQIRQTFPFVGKCGFVVSGAFFCTVKSVAIKAFHYEIGW